MVADTDSESSSETNDFEDYLEEEEEVDQQQQQQQQASAEIETGCNKWWITNLGTTSRKEHKHSSFCQSSKRCEEK